MRERCIVQRVDVKYPYERKGPDGEVIEVFERPPMFDVKFLFKKKKQSVSFNIMATRVDKTEESYEIEIAG